MSTGLIVTLDRRRAAAIRARLFRSAPLRPRCRPISWCRSAMRIRDQIYHLHAGGLALSDPLLAWFDNRLDALMVARAQYEATRADGDRPSLPGDPRCHLVISLPPRREGGATRCG